MNRSTFPGTVALDQSVKNAISPSYPGKPMHPGMPPSDSSGPAISFYEFWPPKLFYIPITFCRLLLSIRYGSTTLPTIANPLFPTGGLFGESKEAVLSKVGDQSSRLVARFTALTRGGRGTRAEADCQQAEARMQEKHLSYPAVVKPDVGCRGVGVQIVRDTDELLSYLSSFLWAAE
jgi:hypothetical protein